ncbi:Methyltransferase domain-containing protein [Nannocystis exedens]|uniref:Methyltransferase domain-containing protein n=1 Tax=Nannocystis exedens TaxID=54 RepID=A0A1I1TB24_9BACT|nr:class I SAM-dependent methyltransferase [Nannocystis exedens]PCC66672.1 methyltransferase [Nannocystis exedens]SFD55775.1 Methyltransferase domain-containing protein [Nannocystis exedens]
MTWQVSPEEWLLDFTIIPRGLARGVDSLDVIDDRLRSMLAPPSPPAGIIIPTITATRSVKPATGPAASPSAKQPTGPKLAAAPHSEPANGSSLSIELRPIGPPAPAPTPPPEAGASMVIPSLTRPGGALVDDDDDAIALERLAPAGVEPSPRDDDVEDVMSAVAASASLLPVSEPEPEAEPEVEEEIQDEAAEAEAEDDELEEEALEEEEEEEVVEARPAPVVEKPISVPPPRQPTGPVPAAEKPGPPRPPAAPPVAPEKASPPRPPPTPEKAGPPRPPPAAAEKPSAPPRPPPEKTPSPKPSPATPPAAPRSDGRKRRNWHEEVFGDHYAAILPVDADASAEIDAAFVQKSLDLTSGQKLLDVGCGDGRHAHAFAALGLDVTGLDNSMPQLLRAARRNEASKFNFDILHGDMRSLPRDRPYDAVTCLGSTFGYFESDEQNRQCLQDMVELLKPGGKLALQVFNRDYLMGVLPCRSWWQGRGCLVLDVADMHFSTGRVRIHRTVVFEDGRQFEHHISIRAYSAHTLAKMLATMGARVIDLSGSRDTPGRFYGGASPEIWIFAQRRDDV